MRKPDRIQLGDGSEIPILYEDRSVLAIDKPAGWMLVPHSWQRTQRNLQAAIVSSIAAGQFWARSRQLKYLRHIHRLDAETSGVLLFGKSPGAVEVYSELFATRQMEKRYLAVVTGRPPGKEWTCRARLAPDARRIGRMRVDERAGKEAETRFRVLHAGTETTLLEAWPVTGRTHQIRVHLALAGHPVVGDPLYQRGLRQPGQMDKAASAGRSRREDRLALRSVSLCYRDPFTRRTVSIQAPVLEFLREFDFAQVSASAAS